MTISSPQMLKLLRPNALNGEQCDQKKIAKSL